MNTQGDNTNTYENPFIMDSEEHRQNLPTDSLLEIQQEAKMMPKHMKNMLRNMDIVNKLDISSHKKNLIKEFVKISDQLKQMQKKMIKSLTKKCHLFALNDEFDSDEDGPIKEPQMDQCDFDTTDNLTVEDKMQFERTTKMMEYVEDEVAQRLFQQFGEITCTDHRCKLCGELFQTGRQLGGHMSRKHPGMSESYNTKKIIHKYKKGERARKEYFKALSGIETVKKIKEKAQRKQREKVQKKIQAPEVFTTPLRFERSEDDYPILEFNREMLKQQADTIYFERDEYSEPEYQFQYQCQWQQAMDYNQMEEQLILPSF